MYYSCDTFVATKPTKRYFELERCEKVSTNYASPDVKYVKEYIFYDIQG